MTMSRNWRNVENNGEAQVELEASQSRVIEC